MRQTKKREPLTMKKPTYQELQNKVNYYEEVIAENRKIVRKAIVDAGLWDPSYNENEFQALAILFQVTKGELNKKGQALHEAIDFIGKFENDAMFQHEALTVLNKINLLVSGETLNETMKRKGK